MNEWMNEWINERMNENKTFLQLPTSFVAPDRLFRIFAVSSSMSRRVDTYSHPKHTINTNTIKVLKILWKIPPFRFHSTIIWRRTETTTYHAASRTFAWWRHWKWQASSSRFAWMKTKLNCNKYSKSFEFISLFTTLEIQQTSDCFFGRGQCILEIYVVVRIIFLFADSSPKITLEFWVVVNI